MRIQYTLPGLLPAPSPIEKAEQFPGTFKTTMRRVRTASFTSWRRLLRLDRPGASGVAIGPPPRPAGFEMRDVAHERTRWRSMLEQKVMSFEHTTATSTGLSTAAAECVERMLQLLMAYQQQEESISARSVTEARG